MVPRSSLKGGKNSQMVEKGTKKPNTTPNKQNTTTQGPQAKSHQAYRRRFMLKQSRKKASKGLHFTIMSDQRPRPSAAKSWSQCNSPLKNGVLQ